mmetsp:Transcript_26071/g.60327  ORF Transcript_26071/g.60327 Transcript_26071/m.60327 type:complete len:218 (+) Transcript_26071:37-690(+)
MFAPQGRLADLEAAQSLLLLPASPRSRSASERASAECERALSLDATDRRAEQDLGSKTAFELTDVCTVSTLLLVLVCSQNALYSLLRRLSLGIHLTRASDSSVLAAQEMLKLIVAGVMEYACGHVCGFAAVQDRDDGCALSADARASAVVEQVACAAPPARRGRIDHPRGARGHKPCESVCRAGAPFRPSFEPCSRGSAAIRTGAGLARPGGIGRAA